MGVKKEHPRPNPICDNGRMRRENQFEWNSKITLLLVAIRCSLRLSTPEWYVGLVVASDKRSSRCFRNLRNGHPRTRIGCSNCGGSKSSPLGVEKLRIDWCSMILGMRIEERDKEKQKIRVFFCFEKIRYEDQQGTKRDTTTVPQQRRRKACWVF